MPERGGGGGRGGCFKYGCFGCLALLTLLLVGILVVVAIGFIGGVPEERMEQPRLERRLPAPVPGDASADRPERGPALRLGPSDEAVGRVVLDLSEGSFRVAPAPPDEPVRIDGRYDGGVYELVESFEQPDEGPWIYRVSFRRRINWMRAIFSEAEEDNRINISLPRGTPFVLEGRIGAGESILALGGLAVRGVDLELGAGSHELTFDEPTPIPMERFLLRAGIGDLSVSSLGNASPREVKVRHSIGEVDLDLRGAWLGDADVYVRCGFGDCAARLPDDVGLELVAADVSLGEATGPGLEGLAPAGEDRPVLRLDMVGKIGEVRVSR